MEPETKANETTEAVEQVDISWDMFEKDGEPLGSGAYGMVYKVKSRQSTSIGGTGNERRLMTKKSIKAA